MGAEEISLEDFFERPGEPLAEFGGYSITGSKRLSSLFVVLMAIVNAVAIETVSIVDTGAKPESGVVYPAKIVGIVIAFSIGIIVLAKVYKYIKSAIPEVIKKAIKHIVDGVLLILFLAAVFLVTIWAIGEYGHIGGLARIAIVAALIYGMVLIDNLGLDWILKDIITIGVTGLIAGVFGQILAENAAVAVLLGMAAWDYIAVIQTDIMESLIGATSSGPSATIGFVIPATLRSELPENPIESDDVFLSIGGGDFMWPTILTGAAWNAGSVYGAAGAAIGGAAGMALLTSVRTEEILPGLPLLCTTAAVGWAIGTAVGMVL